MTPIQESINQVRALKDRDYSKEEIITVLQSLLPKEKEFAEKCFDAGVKSENTENGVYYTAPDKEQFLNNLYAKK